MKPQLYGIAGMAIGLIAFLSGLAHASGGGRYDFAIIGVLGGIYIFGCGMIAAAVGARTGK